MNVKLLKFLSQLQMNVHLFSSRINIKERRNLWLLSDPAYVGSESDKEDYPNLFQKHSEEWIEIVKESYTTDEIAGDVWGLSGLKSMKIHYRCFILENFQDYFTLENWRLKANIDGVGVGTLSSLVTPGLLPS